MELTRVRDGGVERATRAAVPGGDTDLLALLLDGSATTAAVFPATLEAALAGGERTGDPSALGEVGGGTGDGSDGETGTVDLAVAAALALGAAFADANGPEAATLGAPGDAAAADGEAASALGGAVTNAGAGLATGGALVAAPAAVTVPTTNGEGDATAARQATAEAASPATSDAAAEATLADPAPVGGVAAAATVEPPASAAAVAGASGAIDPRVGDGKPVAKANEGAPAEHGAGAGIAHAETPSFSSGAAEQHGLDLGSSDRHGATLASETPASDAAASVGASAPPVSEGATARPLPHADGGSTSTVTTTAVGSAPTVSHDSGVARATHAAQHPGGIEPRWGERVADAVRLSAVRGGGEIRLQLEPEGLGHIDVRLHVQGDGVRAVIVAEHESTRALLTSQQQALHEAFERSDLRLSGFSVDVGSGGGAATFAPPDEQGRSGGAASEPPPTGTAANAPVEAEASSAPLADGRVSVRV